ncbi:hypothetical protein [Massilia endophytica]|uniref:hypothetical protein n=1 Tax=Massilia endophytica TaxID=2899220 RepID=UPI001E302783|nr:hypothetical protein [Massilia endophytica]UGQ48232.1 hypothetical protein LSQ66_07155 [Massilia endophytica]
MKRIILVLGLLLSLGHASAQVTVVPAIVAGAVAKDVINDINDKLRAHITQATISGDYLLEKSARELQLLLANSDTVLKGNIDRTFDHLTQQQQQFLKTAAEMTNKLDEFAEKTMSIEQFAAMDLNTLLGTLPFVDGNAFLLKRVQGYSQVYKTKGTYTVKFTGQAFKQGRRVLVTINGQIVQLQPFSTDYVAVAEIPVSLVNPLFKDKDVNRIKVTVQSWEKRKYLGKLVKGAEKQVLNYDTDILLLPKKPTTVELMEVTAGKGWSQEIYTISGQKLASPTGCNGCWISYEVSVTIPMGTLMIPDRTRAWVSSGVAPGTWGNWSEGIRFTDVGPNGPTRAARIFAHQIHDQARMLDMEVSYRKPLVTAGRRKVALKEAMSNEEVTDGLAYDVMYEGTFSEEYAGYYLRLKLFNGKEVTLNEVSPNPPGIVVSPNIQSSIKRVTVTLKNPYEQFGN